METESLLASRNSSLMPADIVSAGVELRSYQPGEMRVIRRNGQVHDFDASKISVAITKAFLAVEGGSAAASRRIHEVVASLAEQVVTALSRRLPSGGTIHIEDIQDQVELALMRGGYQKVARAYVLYREERARLRAEQQAQKTPVAPELHVTLPDGTRQPLDVPRLQALVDDACSGLEDVDGAWILDEARRNLFDGVPEKDVESALLMAARTRIEQEPNYAYVAARLLLSAMRREAHGFLGLDPSADYRESFVAFIHRGAELELLSSELTRYDLDQLAQALQPERDLKFNYLGLQTLYDRYFIHSHGVRFELPQAFFMRVAMGLASNEIDREARAIEFYHLLSSFDFMSSTPTLFNAGTLRPQLSSCYLTTVPDALDGIYSAIKDNALLSKYAGGLGNDWSRVRGLGAHIKGTNGKSQGVVPFLKVANDTAVAVNQGGKRLGAVCAYLETWHIDIEEFLELRKNTGDDRRRTHDMNTANWVPDLFLKRVVDDQDWTLFSPSDTPDLHDLTGLAFERRYQEYEAKADRGEITLFKRLPASQLWRKMLSMLFETGHPWITFKDPCNLRYTNQHVGVVHSSNLCVAPETSVLTEHGHIPISHLAGSKVKVWNGEEFSEVEVFKTGENQKLIKVVLSDGAEIDCTPYHKFYVQEGYWHNNIVEKRAHELKAGDKLIKFSLPVLEGCGKFPYAYTAGFFCGDGTYGKGKPILHLYGDKRDLVNHLAIRSGSYQEQSNGRLSFTLVDGVPQKFTVPHSYSIRSRLDWLAGLIDADGTVSRNGDNESIQIASVEKGFLNEVRLMLQTLGVTSKVSLMREATVTRFADDQPAYECQPLYRLLIGSVETQKLLELGLTVHRVSLSKRTPNRSAAKFVQVMEVRDEGRVDDTYCFTEPKRHMGVFNGILTGQCTEITLHTNDSEVAVCNLGSVNLAAHITPQGTLDADKLQRTIATAMRMLDNVIDINYYSVPQARRSNLRHRPVGLGLMGFQDALYKLGIPYASEQAIEFADRSMELISYHAIRASTDLAEERGVYASYAGSLWSQGILPIDSVARVEVERGGYLQQDRSTTLDWDILRERVRKVGMRNSNCLAIAPTATISNICGVSQSIEPTYQNLFVKSNLSGEFTIVNPYLVAELKQNGLWDAVMINDLKYYDGSLQKIERVPEAIKQRYATAFELDARWLIEAASRRQKWIDQAQSLNLYLAEPSGKKLDNLYKLAWVRGLKTTYYLRTLGATHVEKSTAFDGKLNAVSAEPEPKVCRLDDPTCEACQ